MPIDQNTRQGLDAQNSYLGAVLQRLGMGGGGSALLGSGMAQGAAQSLQNDAYRKYAQEAQALNQQPMPVEQWMQQQQLQQQQPVRGLMGQ